MATHTGSAIWHGGLKEGKGNINTETGSLNAAYSYTTRFEDDRNGTNPEELIGGALAGCFSMFLASLLEKHDHKPKHIQTDAHVTIGKDERGPFITGIELEVEAAVKNIADNDFQELVKEAKTNCPVGRALGGVPEIKVTAILRDDE
jgi:osmotically inducible protein OsmC